jgi:tetratricopeptide (TPR) repeat protein
MTVDRSELIDQAYQAHAAGNVTEALSCFVRAAEMNSPGGVEFFDLIGHCHAALGQSEEAIEYYTAFIAKDRSSGLVWSNLAVLSFHRGQFEIAAQAMGELIRIQGPVVETYLLRLVALNSAGNDDQIIELFEDFVREFDLEFESTKALFYRLSLIFPIERRDHLYDLLLESIGQNISIRLTAFDYFVTRGRLDHAQEVIEGHIRPKYPISQNSVINLYSCYGKLLLETNQVEIAIDKLQAGLKRLRSGKGGALLMLLGCAYSRSNEPILAAEYYRIAGGLTNEVKFRLLRTSFRCQ